MTDELDREAELRTIATSYRKVTVGLQARNFAIGMLHGKSSLSVNWQLGAKTRGLCLAQQLHLCMKLTPGLRLASPHCRWKGKRSPLR